MRAVCGLKVATRPVAASRVTDAAMTGVSAGAGPVTLKVAALTVAGSMRRPEGTLNVALAVALGHTPVALTAGLVESTDTLAAGAAAAVVKVHT